MLLVKKLFQKALNDLLFRLLFGQSERHELGELFSRDLADGRLMDEFGVHAVRRQRGQRGDRAVVHDDGVALAVPRAFRVAVDDGGKFLVGVFRRDRTGNDVGSRAFSHAMRKKMRAAGAQVRVFNRLLSRFTFAMNYRDHRKIIVIDGKIAYTGGSNVADEYINEKHMHGYWKDTGLRIEGEAVDSFTLFFLRQWEFITNKKCEYIPYMGHYERFSSPYVAAPYVDGPEYELTICKSVFENVISSARERLYIMTPYFIPDDSVTKCIINKALSDVDVRIILPSVPDKYYVYLVTRDNAEKLIKHGVKIYYLRDSFVHSKLAINETCAVVGTVNFDMRSFYQQFEDALLTDDQNVLAQINADFENTFPDCDNPQKPAKNGLVKTVAIALLRLVSPLM